MKRLLCKSVCAGNPGAGRIAIFVTVVRGIEIAIFAAKWDPLASDFDRIPSLWGSGFRKTGAGSAQPAPWPAPELVNAPASIRPSTATGDCHHSRPVRPKTVRNNYVHPVLANPRRRSVGR